MFKGRLLGFSDRAGETARPKGRSLIRKVERRIWGKVGVSKALMCVEALWRVCFGFSGPANIGATRTQDRSASEVGWGKGCLATPGVRHASFLGFKLRSEGVKRQVKQAQGSTWKVSCAFT